MTVVAAPEPVARLEPLPPVDLTAIPPAAAAATPAELEALLDSPHAARFCSKLIAAPAPIPELGTCLLWDRPTDRRGYGSFQADGKPSAAHLWVWRLLHGPVPQGLELHHFCHEAAVNLGTCEGGPTCVHRRCVIHLQPVTHRENMLRGNTFQAEQAARVWCTGKWGPHDLTDPKNVYTPPDPARSHERHCRRCNKARVREFRAKRSALRARSQYGEQLDLLGP